MGTVVRFPDPWQVGRGGGHIVGGDDVGKVIILPVIRIERHAASDPDIAPEKPSPGRGRGRRASRP